MLMSMPRTCPRHKRAPQNTRYRTERSLGATARDTSVDAATGSWRARTWAATTLAALSAPGSRVSRRSLTVHVVVHAEHSRAILQALDCDCGIGINIKCNAAGCSGYYCVPLLEHCAAIIRRKLAYCWNLHFRAFFGPKIP